MSDTISCNNIFMRVPAGNNNQTRFFENIYKSAVQSANLQVPFDVLERGRALIRNERDCTEYIAAYSGQHFHKLYAAFASTNFAYTEGRNVEIIDWGAGLATATCILIDYLIENNISPNITSITLIEPSLIALEKGQELIYRMFQTSTLENCEIRLIEKFIDDVTTSNLASEDVSIKIHLFSNIIDMEVFDLNNLYELIVRSYRGTNRLICTSPDNNWKHRLDLFYQLFEQSHELTSPFVSSQEIYGEIFYIANQQYSRRRIGRYERQFTVDLSQF